jgi:hypothetical protein
MKAMRDAEAQTHAYAQLRRREERASWIQVALICVILLLTGLLTSGVRWLW